MIEIRKKNIERFEGRGKNNVQDISQSRLSTIFIYYISLHSTQKGNTTKRRNEK